MAKVSVGDKRKAVLDEAAGKVEAALEDVSSLYDELEEIRSNMEEKFGGTDKYQRLEELCTSLEEVKGELESARDNLESIDPNYS